jgi:hypothetical protein
MSRRSLVVSCSLALGLAVGGCPPRDAVRSDEHRVEAPSDGGAAPAPACRVRSAPLSPPGREGARPSVAYSAGGSGFLAAWEEEAAGHRAIFARSFDEEANPRGEAVELADVVEGGAEPRVAADGDGFVVAWTIDRSGGEAAVALRRVDGLGRPRGPVAQVLVARDARALAVARAGAGFAVGWWSWTATPPVEWITFTDATGRALGRPIALSQGPLVEAAIDLVPDGDGVRAAWIETRDGIDHVVVGLARPGGVSQRADLGAGVQPTVVDGGAIVGRPADGLVVQLAPGSASTVASGYAPEASARAVCYFRNVTGTGDQKSVDELRCRMRASGDEALVAALPGGVLGLAVADGPAATGVVYQTEEESTAGAEMRVHFAAVRCGGKASRAIMRSPSWKIRPASRR